MELSPAKIELWLIRAMELYRGRRRWRLTKEVERIVGLEGGLGRPPLDLGGDPAEGRPATRLHYEATAGTGPHDGPHQRAAGEVEGTKQASVEQEIDDRTLENVVSLNRSREIILWQTFPVEAERSVALMQSAHSFQGAKRSRQLKSLAMFSDDDGRFSGQ